MIHVFIGTKAQLIKMAPVMKALQEKNIDYNFIFSGQHHSTVDNIREEFGVKRPNIVLYNGPDITGVLQMFIWAARIIVFTLRNRHAVWQRDNQGVVLNHGDTFSTLLGTMLAKICGLKSAHIESGLRSFNWLHPFPEEITRRLIFMLSDFFYAPGQWAINNLNSYNGLKIDTENNTLLDALKASQHQIENVDVDVPSYPFGIISIHRFENIFTRKKLSENIKLIERISDRHRLLMILHKPTLKKLHRYGLFDCLDKNPRIELRPRYSYFQFIKLVRASVFVVTDGGSNQEECYFLGKPCLLLRKATERNEGINENVLLSCYEPSKINTFFDQIDNYRTGEKIHEASPTEIIVNSLLNDIDL